MRMSPSLILPAGRASCAGRPAGDRTRLFPRAGRLRASGYAAVLFTCAALTPRAAAAQCNPSYFDVANAVYAQVMEYGGGGPRVGGTTGTSYWAGQLQAGITVKAMISAQVHGTDYRAKFITGRTDQDALTELYRHLLAREPEDAAFSQLAATGPQNWDALMDAILNGTEYNDRFGDYAVPGDPVQAWDCARASVITVAHNETFRNEEQGSATVTYATPAYITLDQPRSMGFTYISGTAKPSGLVQVNMIDNSGDAPSRASIRLQVNGGWVTNELFFTAGSGATLLSARFDAATYPSSSLAVTAVVKKYWTDGRTQEKLVSTRAPIVNQRQSAFGAGWTLDGLQQLNDQGTGVFITEGGTGLWFWKQGCDGAGNCRYASPAGDFTRLRRDGATGTFIRTYRDGGTVVMNAQGRMVSAGDRFGNTSAYGYDTSGRLTSVTDPIGKVSTLSYTGTGALAWVEDPMGRRVNTTATGASLWRFWAPDGSLALDMQMVQDATGAWMLDTYWLPAGDRSVAQWGWHYIYDAYGRVATFQQPIVTTTDAGSTRPAVTQVSLEKAVLPAAGTGTATAPATRVVPGDVRVEVTDPRGNTTRVALDAFGAPVVIEQPFLRTTLITRDRHGRVTRADETNGHYITYTYISGDLVKARDNVANVEVNYEYEPVFHQLTHISGTGTTEVWNTYSTDAERKLISTRSGTLTSPATSYAYTTRGRVDSILDPEGHGTFLTYDPTTGNRATTAVGTATGSYRRTAYRDFDRFGRDSAATSPGGEWAKTEYDILNRVIRGIRLAGTNAVDTTAYSYPTALAYEVRDAKGQVYRFNRNVIGWTVSEVDPRGQTTSYGYDRAGNATSRTNRRGQAVSMTYDALNRLSTRVADGVQTTYTYGGNDAWVQAANPVSTIRTENDAFGRPVRTLTTLGGITYTAESVFDNLGRRTGIDVTGPWSGMRSVRYMYGGTGMLDSVVDFSGRTTRFSHNDDGQETGRVLPTGAVVQSEFGSTHAGIMTRVDQAISLNRGYSLDANGRIAGILREYRDEYSNLGQISRTFQYDTRGFLTNYQEYKFAPGDSCGGGAPDPDTGACRPVPENDNQPELLAAGAYSYDKLGNRLDIGATIATGNRLTAWNGYTLTYDSDGNLLQRSKPNMSTTTLQWNSLGQLTYASRTGTGGGSATYAYDPAGRRVQRTDGGSGVIRTLYDGDDILMELDGSGNPVREYTYLPGVDNPLSVRSWAAGQSGAAYYYSLEQPGHVAGLISTTGQLANEYHYDPYGTLNYATEGVAQPLKYGARELDAATGLYYLRARWYDPDLGRFVSEDPIGLAGGINPYAYVGSSPMNGTDPSGLCYNGAWAYFEFRGNSWNPCPPRILDALENTIGIDGISDLLGGGGGRIGFGGSGGGGAGGGGGNTGKPESRCMAILGSSAGSESGQVKFVSLSGTWAFPVGGVLGGGFYVTEGGDFGTFQTRGIAGGLDISADLHVGRSTSMSAFAGLSYNACGGAGVVSGCIGGNKSGAVASGGFSLGVPSPNGSVSATYTKTRSWRQAIADRICR